MLGDDRSKGDIKLQQGIRLFGKNEMRKYYYYNIARGNRLGWELKSDDVIWKAIRMEWRLPTTVHVFQYCKTP